MAILSTNVIASASWTAGGYDYVLDVEEVGASADTNDLTIISPITNRCGDPNYSPLEPVLERVVSFRLRDAALYLQGQFATAGANKHLLNITRDASPYFRGYIDTRFQSYLAWLDNPEFEVNAFDGLALLEGFPWLRSGDETLREQLFAILDLTGLGLPINIVGEWKHDGADASTEPPDALRWRSEDWLPENSTYADALRALCSFFNAQCFQRDGEWWFVQRTERSASLTVYPTDNTGAADTAYTLDPDYTATDSILLRDHTAVIEYPSTSLVTIKQEWIDRGLRNGGFELLNSRYWEDGGTGALASASGGWTMDTNGDYVEQEVGHTLMAVSGTRDKLVVHLDFSMEVDASASGTGTVGNAFLDYLEVKLIEADGTVLYDDGANGGSNAWTASQTYVQYPFLLAASAGTTVSETDLKWTTPVAPSSPCKIVVKFIFQSNPNSDGDYINSFTINRAWVYHARPDAEDDIERPEAFTYAQGNTQGGEHLEQSFILGDAYDRHLTPGVMQYYDGSAWQFTTDWNGSGQKIHKKRLDDIVAQLGARIPGYTFAPVWGEEVDILSSIGYGGSVYVPVHEERIIHPVGAHSVRVSGYKILGVTHAPSAEAGTIFFTTQASSSNTLVTGNSLMRRNTDGTTETLYTFVGSEPTSLCIDPTQRYIFTVQGLKIWRCYFDGSDMTNIYTESGYTNIGGIDFMTGGTYDGYMFYGVNGGSGVADDVYRLDRDGNNHAKVSNNTYTSQSSHVVCISTTSILCDANFSNLTLLLYAAAGSNYTNFNTNPLSGGNFLVAADVSGNRYWTVATGGTLKETNNAGASYTDRTAISNGTDIKWDATGARLLIASINGIHYRAGAAINTDLTLTPATGGTGTTGNYGTNCVVAVQ